MGVLSEVMYFSHPILQFTVLICVIMTGQFFFASEERWINRAMDSRET